MINANNKILTAWIEAAKDLEIEIEAPFIEKKGSEENEYLLLVRYFGSKKGTLINQLDSESNVSKDWNRKGYNLTSLNVVHYGKYNKNLFINTLKDWGWYGDIKKKPKWC